MEKRLGRNLKGNKTMCVLAEKGMAGYIVYLFACLLACLFVFVAIRRAKRNISYQKSCSYF